VGAQLSTTGVLLMTWSDKWNAAVQATTTNQIHILVPLVAQA
jgi:hypothetical protein